MMEGRNEKSWYERGKERYLKYYKDHEHNYFPYCGRWPRCPQSHQQYREANGTTMLSVDFNYWQKSFMCCVRPSDKHRPWQVPSMSQPLLCWAQSTAQKITRKMGQRWVSAERGNRHQNGVISLTKCLCYTHMVIAVLFLSTMAKR